MIEYLFLIVFHYAKPIFMISLSFVFLDRVSFLVTIAYMNIVNEAFYTLFVLDVRDALDIIDLI